MFERTPRWGLLGAIAIAAVAAGVATGAIPSGDGTIHACYKQSGGAVRLVDDSASNCANGEVGITWAQQGPPGPQGEAGAQGEPGPVGPQGQKGTGVLRANVIRGDTGFCNPQDPTTPVFPCGRTLRLGAGDATGVELANNGFVVTFDEDVSTCSGVATMGFAGPDVDPEHFDFPVIEPEGILVTRPGQPSINDVTVRLYVDGSLQDVDAAANADFGTSFQLLVAC